jgi:triosephosphate isomerase
VLVGHSERRQYYHETNEMISRKVSRSLAAGLKVVLCVGETLEEREAKKTEAVIEEQITKALETISGDNFTHVMIAYEPRWAIGTNFSATPKQAEEVHAFCRSVVARGWSKAVADKMVIMYGGSVRPDNAKALLEQENIDGLLVGGASLLLDSFMKILHCQMH